MIFVGTRFPVLPSVRGSLGTGGGTTTDEFSGKFQRGEGVIFYPKIFIADFGPLYRALKIKQGLSETNCNISFQNEGGVKGRLDFFRKFIRFGRLNRP